MRGAMNASSLLPWIAGPFLASTLFTHTVALRLLLLLFGTAVATLYIAKERQSLRIAPPIWLPFALWAAWVALSLTWSQEPGRSIKEFRNEIGYAALALWVCFIAGQARNPAKAILPVVGAGALLVCGISIYYFFFDPQQYQGGWQGGSGNFSSALLTLVPCVVMAGWLAVRAESTTRARILLGALAVILLAGAYTTLNRTIWVGFTAQLLLIGWLLARRGRGSLSVRTRLAAGAAAAVLVVAGAGALLHVQSEREEAGMARGLSNDPRLPLWSETADQIVERPLTGYGFGRGILRKSLREQLDDGMLWHAHNLVLDTVIQVGLPGLVLLLLLLGATARAGWRLAGARDEVAAACGMALIAIVAGMLIRNMTDILWLRQNALFFWGTAGALLGYAHAQSTRHQRASRA